jgi:hypothetical protein
MKDEDLNPSQTQEEEEQLEDVASDVQETPEEPEQEEQEEPKEPEAPKPEEPEEEPELVEEEPEQEEEAPVSRRENKRIATLTKKLAEAYRTTPTTPQPPHQLFGDGGYDADEANAIATEYGQQQYLAGLAQANALEFKVELELDVPRVAQKYPVLDPESADFDPGIADYMNRKYLTLVGYDPSTGTRANPTLRYGEFAEAEMEFVETLASMKNVDTQKNLAKQAAKTGLRPSGPANKPYQGNDPSKMTDKQLDDVINQAMNIKK